MDGTEEGLKRSEVNNGRLEPGRSISMNELNFIKPRIWGNIVT
jgi:hypothetical protein